MKIFSNFDTDLSRRLLHEAAEKYGSEYVLCVRRGRVYLLVRLFFPVVLRLFLSGCLLWIYYGLIGTKSSFSNEAGFVTWGLVISLTIYLIIFAIKKLMNYHLDFVIITPDQLVSYDQEGVLTRTTRSLELRKIKTVNVFTDGRLSTLFNYGNIVFLAEGDMQHGDIKLKFINNPVQLRKTIYFLIEHRDSMREDALSGHMLQNELKRDDD